MATSLERAIDTAKLFCNEVREIRQGILAGTFYEAGDAGKLFLDCRGAHPKTMEEFRSFQEGLLVEEYYSTPGAQRWNLYLALVCEESEYTGLVSSGAAELFEQDQLYARKLVLCEENLEEELVARFHRLRAQATNPVPDVVGDWIELLSSAELDGVFMEKQAMDKIVSRFVEGRPVKSRTGSSGVAEGSDRAPRLGLIDSVRLKRYRDCLSYTKHRLGHATLIEGRNGAGKTSLLEAIELWMCGQTLRNPGHKEAEGEIGLRLEGRERFAWNHSLAPAEYRRRALDWYGVHRARANVLHESFGRFNFFDTDAATRLVQSTAREEILGAFNGLVLGRDAAVILERARGIHSRMDERRRALEKSLAKQDNERRRIRGDLKDAEDGARETEADLLGEVLGQLKSLAWKSAMPSDSAVLSGVATELGLLESGIAQCVEHTGRPAGVMPNELPQYCKGLEEASADLGGALETTRQSSAQMEHIEATILQLEDYSLKTERLRPYVFDPDASKLAGLAGVIDARKAESKRLSDALDLADTFDIGLIGKLSGTFREANRTREAQLAALRARLRSVRGALEEQRELVGRLDSLTNTILTAASQLLDLEPERSVCPLCGHKHTNGRLRRQLRRQQEGPRRPLEKLELKLSEGLEEEDKLKREVEQIEILSEAAAVLTDDEPSELHILQFHNRLPRFRAARTRSQAKLGELEKLKVRFAARGMSEEEYVQLLAWHRETSSDVEAHYEHRAAFDRHQKNLKKELASRRKELVRVRKEIAAARKQGATILASLGFSPDLTSQAVSLVRDRLDWAKQELEVRSAYCDWFDASESATLGEMGSTVSTTLAAIRSYFSRKQASEETRQLARRLQSQMKRCTESLNEVRETLRRVEGAVDVLARLLDPEHGSRAAVRRSLESALDMLNEVFSILCWPREFSAVRLSTKGLLAVRRETGEEAQITRLSSRQRSALALSTFLALNRCAQSGPPIMLLDDPVVHVDDLNALAFFDTLRILVKSADRQVLFATANAKLASLFRRKFEFLGSGFETITLPLTTA